jgi:16S rRNA (guanine527-N7)-methyltransferase
MDEFYDMRLNMDRGTRDLLVEGARSFGVLISEETAEAFDLYLRELIKWNQKINLTAIRTEKGIILKHFVDSLSVRPHLSHAASLLDIGSGAGFPGIPLKMVHPFLEVTLIDSVRKKVDFQKHVIRSLGLKGIEPIHGRAQDEGVIERLQGRFDAVISRAFSNLQMFLLLGEPFLKKGGMLLAMRGKADEKEVQDLVQFQAIPYDLRGIHRFSLPFSGDERAIVHFEKR